MDALELVQLTSPQLNGAAAAFYFDAATLEAGQSELGLDGFRFYVLGRGGVLGDCGPEVVHSAFGYFHIDSVRTIWNSGKEICAPRVAARAYLAAAEAFGERELGDVDGLDAFNDAAETIITHADDAALALYAGIAAEPLPDGVVARAYRNAIALRELRGSIHLLAIVASGLSAAKAHAIRRPDDVVMFGYAEAPQITDADRAALARADALTDELMTPMFDVLDDTQRTALAAGSAAIAAAIG